MNTVQRTLFIKPIFHWKWASRWLPNANAIYTQKKKCTWPTPYFCVGTQCNLYSTGLRLGFASGKTQILGLASGDFRVFRYQHVGIPKGKVWRWGCKPTPGPDANGLASQWNIGLKVIPGNRI